MQAQLYSGKACVRAHDMPYGLVDRCICLIRNVGTSLGFQHVCTLGAD